MEGRKQKRERDEREGRAVYPSGCSDRLFSRPGCRKRHLLRILMLGKIEGRRRRGRQRMR